MTAMTKKTKCGKVVLLATVAASTAISAAATAPRSAVSDGSNLMSATSVARDVSPSPIVSQYRTTDTSAGRNLISTKKGIMLSFK